MPSFALWLKPCLRGNSNNGEENLDFPQPEVKSGVLWVSQGFPGSLGAGYWTPLSLSVSFSKMGTMTPYVETLLRSQKKLKNAKPGEKLFSIHDYFILFSPLNKVDITITIQKYKGAQGVCLPTIAMVERQSLELEPLPGSILTPSSPLQTWSTNNQAARASLFSWPLRPLSLPLAFDSVTRQGINPSKPPVFTSKGPFMEERVTSPTSFWTCFVEDIYVLLQRFKSSGVGIT